MTPAISTGARPLAKGLLPKSLLAGRIVPSLLVLLAWQVSAGIAASPLLPTPAAVLGTMMNEIQHGSLAYHLGMTLWRVALCFTLAMTIGTAVGVAMGMSPQVNRWLEPWLQLFLNIPAMVVAILAYVWLGLGEPAAIAAVTLSKLPNVVVIMRQGSRQRDRELAEMAQVFRFSPRAMLFDVLLPELAPYLLAAMRSGLALVWKIVLLVELLGRSNGVGFQLHVYFQLLDIPHILAYAASFILVIQLTEWFLMAEMDRRVARWQR